MYARTEQPIKTWYYGPMYRYERPQSGRDREVYQFGVEVFGTNDPMIDAEIISIPVNFYKLLGLKGIKVNINSLGDAESRKNYRDALIEYFKPHINTLCEDCKTRFLKNPLRILDCKVDKETEILKNAPSILDYLNEVSKKHFENVKNTLKELNIEYTIDTGIVRGLDYYTKTVFEFISKDEGYTVLAGGRYDGLVKELGGADTPAIGFAMGMERLVEIYEKYNANPIEPKNMQIYIANIGKKAGIYATKLTQDLRKKGIYVEKDVSERSLKAQFKYADKKNAEYCLTIGEEEIASQKAKIKNMKTGEEIEVNLSEEQWKQDIAK